VNHCPNVHNGFIFCGRQGLALRGHRDSGPLTLEEPLNNDGNFRALLRFKVHSGDQELANHLKMAAENATYLSPSTQNEIVAACNGLILAKLVERVNSAKGFTVLADETTDISGTEQFSLCARYVDPDGNIREDFLQFVPVTDVSGEGLASVIVNSLTEFGLNLAYLRGQGYDGAGAMSGKLNGVQARIRSMYPLAVYVHCASHSLNLAISDACTVVAIRNCVGTLGDICNFFTHSAKRRETMHQSIEDVCPESTATRLKRLCPTRWVERHDAVLVFLELLEPVIDALETVSTWQDRETSSKAHQLLCAVKQPQFLVAIHVLSKVFAVSLPLSRLLQTENMDLCEAINLAVQLDTTVEKMRINADEEFADLFGTIQIICRKLGVSVCVPRRVGRQTHRDNIPAETPEDYFRATVYIPFIDSFLLQLKERLTNHKALLQSFRCLIPKPSVTQPRECDEQDLRKLYKMYADVLDCSELSAVGELCLWYSRVCDADACDAPLTNAREALAACNPITFPAIHCLLHILVTLPVTTASTERSFSTLRRLKTYVRNTTSEERLNGLALLQIHRDLRVAVEEVLDELAKKTRRLGLRL
jgi:hypothetical protein